MTIGQRIAQKRKEQNLSQEALGERLGVSRQSIYKWEADQALPEIDKLVALSKLFGVTVGWLLGVEEEPEPAPQQAPDRELTEAQLNMVKEIVDRYLAALPKPAPPKHRGLLKAGAVLAMAVLFCTLVNLYNQLEAMRIQNESIHNSISLVERSVNSQIDSISGRVEDILKSQNSLTAEYGTEIDACNLGVGRVTFTAYAVPKTYVEGMSAEFLADYGGKEPVSGSCLQNAQRFSGEIKCPLTDTITLSVVFTYPDGTQQTQLLDQYDGLYSGSFPDDLNIMVYEDLFRPVDDNGNVTVPELYFTVDSRSSSFSAVNAAVGRSEITDIRAGLFKNQALVAWAEPCEQPQGFSGDYSDSTFFRSPEATVQMAGDDQLCFAVVATDEYGRERIYTDIPYILGTEGGQTVLTWPDSCTLASDPAGWSY